MPSPSETLSAKTAPSETRPAATEPAGYSAEKKMFDLETLEKVYRAGAISKKTYVQQKALIEGRKEEPDGRV